MAYSESARGQWITQQRAIQELRKHGVARPDDITEFLADMGNREKYSAIKVLEWLGY